MQEVHAMILKCSTHHTKSRGILFVENGRVELFYDHGSPIMDLQNSVNKSCSKMACEVFIIIYTFH